MSQQELLFDDSFSKEVDRKISTEILPYSPLIAHLRSLREQEVTIEMALTPEKVEDAIGESSGKKSNLIETGILDSIVKCLKEADADRKSVRYPPITDDFVVKQNYDDNKDDYYSSRLYQHAEDICQHIDGLIQLDKYPERMFGKYNTIRAVLFKQDEPEKANRLLGQLIIVGWSAIPASKKYEEIENVEPAIQSSVRTTEQQ